jgi:hypothetical protein
MAPAQPPDNRGCMPFTQAIPSSQSRIGDPALSMFTANSSDYLRGDLRHAVSYAARLPALLNRIVPVLRVRAQEQVTRIAAKAVVTAMANIEAGRYRPVVQGETEAVRKFISAIDRDQAVAVLVPRSRPRPTSIRPARHIEARPEPLFKWEIGIDLGNIGVPPASAGAQNGEVEIKAELAYSAHAKSFREKVRPRSRVSQAPLGHFLCPKSAHPIIP